MHPSILEKLKTNKSPHKKYLRNYVSHEKLASHGKMIPLQIIDTITTSANYGLKKTKHFFAISTKTFHFL